MRSGGKDCRLERYFRQSSALLDYIFLSWSIFNSADGEKRVFVGNISQLDILEKRVGLGFAGAFRARLPGFGRLKHLA